MEVKQHIFEDVPNWCYENWFLERIHFTSNTFVLDMFSMEETPSDAVFSNVKLPLWPVLYSGCGASLGPCRLVGGRIEHAGNQPSVVSIHIYALAKFYKQIASKDHHSWKYLFTKHTQKQFLSFFWAFGEVELFLRMLSNTPAALHYWLATSLKIVVYSITYILYFRLFYRFYRLYPLSIPRILLCFLFSQCFVGH